MDFFDVLVRYEIALWNAVDQELARQELISLGQLHALRVVDRYEGRARVQERERRTSGSPSGRRASSSIVSSGPDSRREARIPTTDARRWWRSPRPASRLWRQPYQVCSTAVARLVGDEDVETLTAALRRLQSRVDVGPWGRRRDRSQPPSDPVATAASERRPGAAAAAVSTSLVLTLALQTAVPPFATDMYTPAFPRVTTDLATSASLVGLTLTTFFLGMALGQLLGGPLSDQRGRRIPLIVGGLICTLGAVGCAVAPSIELLDRVPGACRASAAASRRWSPGRSWSTSPRGDLLAKVMSIMMALGGLAPMVAPVVGGAVLTLGGTWRTVFWILVGFGLLMMITAIAFVPESLPRERRHGGGLRQFASGLSQVIRIRSYVGYTLTAALSGFTMMAYIANSSYVLQEQKGLQPMPFALFFAATALSQVLLSIVNAKIVGRFRPTTD